MANKANISILTHEDCCGCRACGDICPVKCIIFQTDSEGFYYPVVDESICVRCGRCADVCPELNVRCNDASDDVMAAYATSPNKRQEGSSGGLFGVLASYFIDKGGKVWGASFDNSLKLKHTSATTPEELKLLLRSKYLQSDTSECYRQIAKDLKNGIITLFAGTPCQCNALRNYVGQDERLYLIDVICHGVPSQDLFDRSIHWLENKQGCKVKEFTFRSKYKGALHPQAFSYICEKKGKLVQINGLHYQFPFYFGFQKYITLRPSCYTCKWAKTERAGDITLGDFWGIERLDPSLDPKTGISEVIVNTDKGDRLIKDIIENGLIWSKSFTLCDVVLNNGCLHSPTRLKPERAELFSELESDTFDNVVRKHLVSKRQWIFDIYYALPGVIRKFLRKIMDKRMRYE